MRKTHLPYDDMDAAVFDLAMAVKEQTGRWPDLLRVGPASAERWNMEAGIWHLDNGTWIWIRYDNGTGLKPEILGGNQ